MSDNEMDYSSERAPIALSLVDVSSEKKKKKSSEKKKKEKNESSSVGDSSSSSEKKKEKKKKKENDTIDSVEKKETVVEQAVLSVEEQAVLSVEEQEVLSVEEQEVVNPPEEKHSDVEKARDSEKKTDKDLYLEWVAKPVGSLQEAFSLNESLIKVFTEKLVEMKENRRRLVTLIKADIRDKTKNDKKKASKKPRANAGKHIGIFATMNVPLRIQKYLEHNDVSPFLAVELDRLKEANINAKTQGKLTFPRYGYNDQDKEDETVKQITGMSFFYVVRNHLFEIMDKDEKIEKNKKFDVLDNKLTRDLFSPVITALQDGQYSKRFKTKKNWNDTDFSELNLNAMRSLAMATLNWYQ